jgi:hypothetical protein
MGNLQRRSMRAIGAVLSAVVAVAGTVLVAHPAPATASTTGTDLGITSFADIAVDPATGRIVVAGGDHVVVAEPDGSIAASIPLAGAAGLSIEGSDLWVTQATAGKVSRIDLDGLAVDETYTVGTTVGHSIAVVDGAVLFTGNPSYSRYGVLRLDPATGLVHDMGVSIYGGRIAEIPGSTTHVLLYDNGLSPYSVYRTDVSGSTAVLEDDVPHGVGSNLREVVATDHGTFVTASGSPYQFTEFALATMDPTGVVYSGTHYPAGIAYTPHGGGVFAGMTQSTGKIFVHRTGVPTAAFTLSPSGTMQYRSVEIAPDASAVYAVTSTTGTDSLRLQVLPLAPVVDRIVPAAVPEGVPTTVEVRGSGFAFVTGVSIDGSPVPFAAGVDLSVDVPGSLAAGPHDLLIETGFGSVTTTLVVANLPGVPSAPAGAPGPGQVTVSWTPALDGGTPITAYEVRTQPGEGSCTTSGLWCVVDGLANGEDHEFSVRAVNAIGAGPWSAWSASVVPASVPLAPAMPDVVAGDGTAEVAWSPPSAEGSPILGYEVRTSPDSAGCSSGTTSCEVDGLTNGVPYRFSVRATNALGAGEWSPWSEPALPTGCGSTGGPFVDVPGTSQFCSEIEWLVARGITNGYGDGSYRPTNPITRMSLAAMLYRYEYEPSFTAPVFPRFLDVPGSHPFYGEIEWLAHEGLANGYADGTYRPATPVSRQSLAAMLHRLSGSPPSAPSSPTFSDVPPSHPFYDEIEWMAASGLSGGYADGTFRGAEPVSRQALAAFLYRLSQR